MDAPIFIKEKIMIFSIKYPYQDICNLLMEILNNYYKMKLKYYFPPYQLSFCRAKCSVCEKIIFNECYSEIIDLNFGWIHCNECKETIKLWSSSYLENSYKFPIDYVKNIDVKDPILFLSEENKKKKGYINIFCKYLYLNNSKIYIAILWKKKEKQMIEWILLEKILKNIYIEPPPYFSLKTFNYWESKIDKINNSKYLNLRF